MVRVRLVVNLRRTEKSSACGQQDFDQVQKKKRSKKIAGEHRAKTGEQVVGAASHHKPDLMS